MDNLHIPVQVETKSTAPMGTMVRTQIGTVYFKQGSTANDVCKKIMERQKTTTGLWLLQKMVPDPANHKEIEDGCYVTVKDSKYKLQDGNKYVCVYYNGPIYFLHNLS